MPRSRVWKRSYEVHPMQFAHFPGLAVARLHRLCSAQLLPRGRSSRRRNNREIDENTHTDRRACLGPIIILMSLCHRAGEKRRWANLALGFLSDVHQPSVDVR